jgi:protein SCO1/2
MFKFSAHVLRWRTLATVLLSGVVMTLGSVAAAGTVTPADSIYQMKASLTDQHGQTFLLEERRGQPMLISMFYTSCQFVCPMLVEALKATEAKLSEEERARLTVMMVTFDPLHDTVAVLKRTAGERQVDSGRWTLARTDAKTVRKLAAVLGIQYRALANGDFNHTTAMILIDAEGRIAGRTTELGNADQSFVKLVKTATHVAGHP